MDKSLTVLFLLLCLCGEAAQGIFVYGDSKVSTGAFLGQQYTDVLTNNWPFTEASFRVSHGGYAVVVTSGGTFTNVIDADLAATTGTPDDVLLNIGTNDPGMIHTNAAFFYNYNLILDAIHNKWPSARIGCALPWSTQYSPGDPTINMGFWNEIAGAIMSMVSARTYCRVGPDERVYLENGDFGATYTSDGIHYTVPGHALTATNWANVRWIVGATTAATLHAGTLRSP